MEYIYYTYFIEQLPKKVFEDYLCLLPIDQKIKNNRFVHWEDRHRHLFGRLLLIEGLKQFGLGLRELDYLEYSKDEKPILNKKNVDFNISHSGNYVIVGISENSKVGVDIEEIKPVEFNDLKKVFTNTEWNEIKKSSDPLSKFYTFWTRKESLIKADGRGLSISLDQVEVTNNQINIDYKIWYLKELDIHPNYRACLASSDFNIVPSFVEVNFF